MPRKRTPLHPDCPYHVTARLNNKEWFKLPLAEVWSVMEDYLFLVARAFDLRVHAFVLMSNHYHLITTAPQGNLSEALAYLQRETSRELGRLTGRINKIWGDRYYKTMLGRHHHFMNTYKYVYRNPVRAGLCSRPEEWPFSTLHGLLGQRRLIIPVAQDTLLFNDGFDDSTLTWLNTASAPGLEDEMRRALRHSTFNLAPQKQRPSTLEIDLL